MCVHVHVHTVHVHMCSICLCLYHVHVANAVLLIIFSHVETLCPRISKFVTHFKNLIGHYMYNVHVCTVCVYLR